MGQNSLLIVDQLPAATPALQDLLSRLHKEHGLDIYNCRQRLIGRGRSLLHRGDRSTLESLSPLLRQAGIRHWITAPTKPSFAPAIIRALQPKEDDLTFICQKKQVGFAKGDRGLAILADLSGKLVERSVHQLLSSNAYQGRDNLSHLSTEKIFKTILQGYPVLDLYKLDTDGTIIDAVRVLPSKFDHKGLGDRATLSSRQNLLRVLELWQSYTGQSQIETGFGLFNLPGFTLYKPPQKDPDVLRKNLINLTRFGWLMADLKHSEQPSTQNTEQLDLTASISAALLTQNPALAGSEQLAEAMPIIKQVSEEITATTQEETTQQDARPAPQSRALPAPPPPISSRQWRTRRFWISALGGSLVLASGAFYELKVSLPSVISHGYEMGIIPAGCAALMFWGGFHFLKLKRLVENTPTSKIRSVAMGMVEIKGQAIRQYALVSPISSTPCTWYRLTRFRRDGTRGWVVSSVVSSGSATFLLEDETGRVCIDPQGATIRARTREEGYEGQRSLSFSSSLTNNNAREKWVEEIITEGTLLYVLGFAAVKKEQRESLRNRKVEALRKLKRDRAALDKFDADGDGQISPDEWEAARASAEQEAIHQSLQERSERRRQEEQVIIGKPGGNRPFIIAETLSETHLTNRFVRYIIPLFCGAALCTGWAISLLIQWLT